MEQSNRPINISITIGTVIKVMAVLIGLYFLYLIKDVLAVLFIALILSSAFDPWVDWMQEKRIPRSIGVILIYLVTFMVFGAVIYLIIPPIIEQAGDLSANLPQYLGKISSSLDTLKNFGAEHGILVNLQNSFSNLNNNLQNAAGSIFYTITSIFGGIFSFFLILILVFYMVVEESSMKKLVKALTPVEHQAYIVQLINRIQNKIGLWLRGQLILIVIVFLLDYIGLSILGVKYALILALLAGLLEVVPYIGPIMGAIPGVFMAFTQSPMLALFAAALYYIVQMVENNILVPKIMEKAVGLNPILSISALLIGVQIGGIVGAALSIPVATAVNLILNDLFEHRRAPIE